MARRRIPGNLDTLYQLIIERVSRLWEAHEMPSTYSQLASAFNTRSAGLGIPLFKILDELEGMGKIHSFVTTNGASLYIPEEVWMAWTPEDREYNETLFVDKSLDKKRKSNSERAREAVRFRDLPHMPMSQFDPDKK